jgi:hypothetical protein
MVVECQLSDPKEMTRIMYCHTSVKTIIILFVIDYFPRSVVIICGASSGDELCSIISYATVISIYIELWV